MCVRVSSVAMDLCFLPCGVDCLALLFGLLLVQLDNKGRSKATLENELRTWTVAGLCDSHKTSNSSTVIARPGWALAYSLPKIILGMDEMFDYEECMGGYVLRAAIIIRCEHLLGSFLGFGGFGIAGSGGRGGGDQCWEAWLRRWQTGSVRPTRMSVRMM